MALSMYTQLGLRLMLGLVLGLRLSYSIFD